MDAQILNVAVAVDLLYLQLNFIVRVREEIDEILLVYLNHRATDLGIKAFLGKYLIYH